MVATSEPITVQGRACKKDDKTAKTFARLGLPRPFMKQEDRAPGDSDDIPSGSCRLDISGDTHHYERYIIPPPDDITAEKSNYASVVCGMGGAFLHPSHTDFGEIQPVEMQPEKRTSRVMFTQKLVNAFNIMNGGFVWVAGAVISMLLYLAAIVPGATRTIIEWLQIHSYLVSRAQWNNPPFVQTIMRWKGSAGGAEESNLLTRLHQLGNPEVVDTVGLFTCLIIGAVLIYLGRNIPRALRKKATVATVRSRDYWPATTIGCVSIGVWILV